MTDRNEAGTFTVWALALCLMLFGISGISADLWKAYDSRRTLNEIADSASRSGASEIDILQRQLYGKVVLDPVAAKKSAANNIYMNSSLKDVQVENANISVDTTKNEVRVEVESDFDFFLLSIFPGGNNTKIHVSSTARPFEQ